MSASTSHDPKTDHRSILIIAFCFFGAIVCALGAGGVFKPQTVAPVKAYTIDGCDLYRFTEDGKKNYFARCSNGKVATTFDGDKHITTEPK